MPSVPCYSVLFLLLWLLALATPVSQCSGAGPPEKVNTAKKALNEVVLFTATIPQEPRAGEPVMLSLQLKNLGKELLVFDDSALDTFLLKVKTREGDVIRATRYLEYLDAPGKARAGKVRGRSVDIELASGKEAGVILPLDQLYDLSLYGEYDVSVEARFNVKGVPEKVAVANLPFTVRWVPYLKRITKVE